MSPVGDNHKKNILFIIMQMAMGGSEKLVFNLIKNMDTNKFNPSIAWFYGDRVLDEFKSLGIPAYHLPKRKRFDLGTMKQLSEIIKINNIEIINSQHFMSFIYAFYGSKIANKAKLFYTEHSVWEVEKIPIHWRMIGRILIHHTNSVVAVSDEVNKGLRSIFKLGKERVVTVLNGVNLSHYDSMEHKSIYKRRLGYPESTTLIGIVANLKTVKNHLFLIRAFNEVLKECRRIKLLIVGNADNTQEDCTKNEIENFIQQNDMDEYVDLLGYRNDIPDILKAIDIFCLTSRKEGLPLSLTEAMAAGLPVIGTNVDGIRDLIEHRKNGLLVDLDNVGQLRNSILELIRHRSKATEFGEKARSDIVVKFDMKQCMQNYENLFLS